jgi:glutathione S-transferase
VFFALAHSARRAYTAGLEVVNAGLLDHDKRAGTAGPFFNGAKFGWVEVMLFPILARRSALKTHRGFEIPKTEATARLWAWIDACSARPSVIANASTDEWYAEAYAKMAARGDAKAATA